MHNLKKFPVTIQRTPVLGERKVGFISQKMYQNAPTTMQNYTKIQNSWTPVFGEGEGESCLLLKLGLATPLPTAPTKTWQTVRIKFLNKNSK